MMETKRKVGRPPTGFDKKVYDRDRMRRIRAAERGNKDKVKNEI